MLGGGLTSWHEVGDNGREGGADEVGDIGRVCVGDASERVSVEFVGEVVGDGIGWLCRLKYYYQY